MTAPDLRAAEYDLRDADVRATVADELRTLLARYDALPRSRREHDPQVIEASDTLATALAALDLIEELKAEIGAKAPVGLHDATRVVRVLNEMSTEEIRALASVVVPLVEIGHRVGFDEGRGEWDLTVGLSGMESVTPERARELANGLLRAADLADPPRGEDG